MRLPDDPVQGYVDYPPVEVTSADSGPLHGLTMAVKDLYDVAGYRTGGGHPLLRAESPVKTVTAPAVQAVLDAGARFVGKTHTDEFAYSMNGENPHYGTPVNVRAPGRIPGGSSSGSAAVVAAGLVDFAFGTDTGGSIRVPAAYCGIIGLRPTHGRIDISGVQPLARSFDTVGWFARDMEVYQRVAAVLLGEDVPGPALTRAVIAEDIAAEMLGAAEAAAFDDMLRRAAPVIGTPGRLTLAPQGLTPWRLVFRTMQAYEAWSDHGAWIESRRPLLGPGVRERFEWASGVTAADYHSAAAERACIRERVLSVLGDDGVIVVPATPTIAPLRGMEGDVLEAFRVRNIAMQCSAGLSGVPQLSLPIGSIDGCPFALSLIGPPGRDRALLDLGARILAAVG